MEIFNFPVAFLPYYLYIKQLISADALQLTEISDDVFPRLKYYI